MNNLNICLAQMPFKVGDIPQNTTDILNYIEIAKNNGADMIVFPELALIGYPPEDLLLRPSLALRIEQALTQLKQVKDIVIVVGHPIAHGGQLFNTASIIYNGQIFAEYHKQCLPNFGVFDEHRYFKAGHDSLVFTFKGTRIGLLICQDLWEDEPIRHLKNQQADLILVLNASPFEMGKQNLRKQLVAQRAKFANCPVLYVNLVGGQDDLVFDGGSLAFNPSGELAYEAPRFEAHLANITYHIEQKQLQISPEKIIELSPVAETYHALVMGLQDYVNHCGFKGVVLGLSGGIDSALSLAIAVDALGKDRVHAVMMPYEYTAKMSMDDAQLQAEKAGVNFGVMPIHSVIEGFKKVLQPAFEGMPTDTTEENLQARARGTLLMALSNKFGYMVLTTGNKSEMAVGYATLYGDMVGGYNALKDVYKTQVYELAKFRNSLQEEPIIPIRVIERAPSAELRPDQTDQDSLPPYEVLDAILYAYIEQEMSSNEIVSQSGYEEAMVTKVIQLVDRSEYKRKQSALGVRVSSRAFTRERRYPTVNGWKAGL